MKSLIGLLAAFVLTAVAIVPAGAADEVALNEPCTGDNVITATGSTEDVETPMLPGDVTTAAFVLDLAGTPVGTTATVDADLQWGDPTDYDFELNGTASGSFNPIDGDGETVSLTKVKHCQTLNATMTNFAGNPLASMTIEFGVRNIK